MNTRTPLEAVQEATLLAEQLTQTCCIVSEYGAGLSVMPWAEVLESSMQSRVIETVHPVQSVSAAIRKSVARQYRSDKGQPDAATVKQRLRIQRLKANPLQVAI